MSRPLRIEYPNAWYYLMNRGRQGDEVYEDRNDYLDFLGLFHESSEMFNVRIAAYCLMPDHYYLLIQTPDANLSRFMRHLDGVYTQHFNKGHGHNGRLFQGRYKSILVDPDTCLPELLRYIHRKPLETGLEDAVGQYPWTSHNGYVSRSEKWDWLHKDFILSMFSEQRTKRAKYYKKFVAEQNSEEITSVLEGHRLPPILGSKRFVERVKEDFPKDKRNREMPEITSPVPKIEEIKAAICEFYNIDEKELLASKRGMLNEPRNMAIFVTRRLRGDSLDSIARAFNMRKYSSVSSVVNRTQALLSRDRRVREFFEKIHFVLSKGQTWI